MTYVWLFQSLGYEERCAVHAGVDSNWSDLTGTGKYYHWWTCHWQILIHHKMTMDLIAGWLPYHCKQTLSLKSDINSIKKSTQVECKHILQNLSYRQLSKWALLFYGVLETDKLPVSWNRRLLGLEYRRLNGIICIPSGQTALGTKIDTAIK